jgi:hypothetical protein
MFIVMHTIRLLVISVNSAICPAANFHCLVVSRVAIAYTSHLCLQNVLISLVIHSLFSNILLSILVRKLAFKDS